MSEENKLEETSTRANLEVIAPTTEEAIEKGLADLGVSEDAVDIEVLDEGSRGLLGLGSRQSRVRLTIKSTSEETNSEEDVDVSEVEDLVEDELPSKVQVEETGQTPETESGGEKRIPLSDLTQEQDIALHIARETVLDLLERMHVDADVEAYFAEPDDDRSRSPLWVDVTGEDLSILIGHRAETLNALQYITNLILGKELGRSAPLVVDVQGYRKRRAQEVRRVARQMADQAVKSGRRQMLEPMPANERRLVHIELRGNPDVTTQSVGEDPRRKVTILPVEAEGM